MDAKKQIEDMPPLPTKARSFMCTKCMTSECTAETARDMHPLCANCGYLGFGGDVPLTDEQIRAYARDYAAQTLASKEAELVRLREALFGDNGALTRMDRARGWLTDGNPRPECNYGVLDTSDLRAALTQPTE